MAALLSRFLARSLIREVCVDESAGCYGRYPERPQSTDSVEKNADQLRDFVAWLGLVGGSSAGDCLGTFDADVPVLLAPS